MPTSTVAKKTGNKPRNKTAIAAVAIGLLYWMPLFNFLTSAVAIFLGVKALREIRDEHSTPKPSGKMLASAAVILGVFPYYLSIIYVLRTYFTLTSHQLGFTIAVLLPLILSFTFVLLKLMKLI